jgi:hypothetical protein
MRLPVIAFALALFALYLYNRKGKAAAAVAAGTSRPVEPMADGKAFPPALTRSAKANPIPPRPTPDYDPADSPPSQEVVGVAHEDGTYTAIDPSNEKYGLDW